MESVKDPGPVEWPVYQSATPQRAATDQASLRQGRAERWNNDTSAYPLWRSPTKRMLVDQINRPAIEARNRRVTEAWVNATLESPVIHPPTFGEFIDSLSTVEKAALFVGGGIAVAGLLPGIALTALGSLGSALTVGPVAEMTMADVLAPAVTRYGAGVIGGAMAERNSILLNKVGMIGSKTWGILSSDIRLLGKSAYSSMETAYTAARAKFGLFEKGAGSATMKALPSPREFLLSKVENPKLKNMVRYLYREGAEVGNGGTADVLRHELSTGDLYSKSGHIQKAIEARTSLKRLMDSGNLNHQDYGVATSLRQELHEALIEQEWNKIYTNRQAMRN